MIINGHLIWIIPLLIVIATASFVLYAVCPAIEHFSERFQTSESVAQTSESFSENSQKYENFSNEEVGGHNIEEYPSPAEVIIRTPTIDKDDYIFPPVITPHRYSILNETDINEKIRRHESSNVFRDYRTLPDVGNEFLVGKLKETQH